VLRRHGFAREFKHATGHGVSPSGAELLTPFQATVEELVRPA
jgi:hypothetical protein